MSFFIQLATSFYLFIKHCRSHYRLDADGLPLNDDLVQARLKEIMSSHREEMRRLSIELKKAKQMGADTVSKADLLINVMVDDFIELPSDKEVSVQTAFLGLAHFFLFI